MVDINNIRDYIMFFFCISLDSPQGLLMPANGYPTSGYSSNGYPVPNGSLPPALNPALQLTVNTVDAVTEAIKSDRSIRFWKMEALKVISFFIINISRVFYMIRISLNKI